MKSARRPHATGGPHASATALRARRVAPTATRTRRETPHRPHSRNDTTSVHTTTAPTPPGSCIWAGPSATRRPAWHWACQQAPECGTHRTPPRLAGNRRARCECTCACELHAVVPATTALPSRLALRASSREWLETLPGRDQRVTPPVDPTSVRDPHTRRRVPSASKDHCGRREALCLVVSLPHLR